MGRMLSPETTGCQGRFKATATSFVLRYPWTRNKRTKMSEKMSQRTTVRFMNRCFLDTGNHLVKLEDDLISQLPCLFAISIATVEIYLFRGNFIFKTLLSLFIYINRVSQNSNRVIPLFFFLFLNFVSKRLTFNSR